MEQKKGNWKINSSHLQYDNPWISVTEYGVTNPSGKDGIYGKVHYKNIAIGIVPIDENGNIYMVEQFRFVLNQPSLEIPEGGGDPSIDPLVSAKRELKEETGLEASSWDKLLEMHLSNSVSDEKAIVYLARGLKQGEMVLEETEDIQVVKMYWRDAYQKVVDHEITDSMTVAALLKIYVMHLENQL
jgi:8-oxo-dGTP pyrophosphatase MutT (NUDIX family)